nr:hypothetical protein BaRGS_022824 [Batillaria attramentaria]
MSPLAQAVVVVVVTTAMVQFVRRLLAYRSYFTFFNKLPGETDFSWIWGNLHKLKDLTYPEKLNYLQQLNTKYPKFYRLWRGPFYASLSLNHPDTVRQLLKTSEPKARWYKFGLPWLGESLLIASGSKWARSRRLLTPAFHFDILKPYVAVSNAACDVMLEKIEKHAETKKSIEMFGVISLCTFDVILQCAMSYKDDIQLKGREITQPLSLDGVTIPVGTPCTINIINVHHNPTVWPDPYSFKPERFHPDNMKDKDSYAFIPFSAGPRFTFTLDPDRTVTKKPAAVMRTETGMWMIATPRTPSL